MYWNMEALRTLLDHSGKAITESQSCRDSNWRLPLHRASAGARTVMPYYDFYSKMVRMQTYRTTMIKPYFTG